MGLSTVHPHCPLPKISGLVKFLAFSPAELVAVLGLSTVHLNCHIAQITRASKISSI